MRWRFSWLAIATALVLILSSGQQRFLSIDVAHAQRANPRDIAAQVYQQHPEFPLENQYVRQRNGKVADKSTLISRFIEYHTLTKGRSPQFRLDWKFTLADYLGVNDYLQESKYPGHAYLKTNPMANDREIIQSFNRQQRDELVQALVALYGGNIVANEAAESAAPTTPTAKQQPATQRSRPQLQPLPPAQGADLLRLPAQQPTPKPTGDAQLLRP